VQLWKRLLLRSWKRRAEDFNLTHATYSSRSFNLWTTKYETYIEGRQSLTITSVSATSVLQSTRFNIVARNAGFLNVISTGQLYIPKIIMPKLHASGLSLATISSSYVLVTASITIFLS